MEDSLKKRYIVKLIANIMNGILGVIIVAFVPKTLGPVYFGQFSYLQQFFTQIIAFLDAGTSTAFFTKLSANNERKELITFYAFFVTGLLFLLLCLIYLLDIFNYIHVFLPNISIEHIYLGMFFGFLTWVLQIYIQISDANALTSSIETIKIVHKTVMVMFLIYIIHFLTFSLSIYFYYHAFSLVSIIGILSMVFVQKGIYRKSSWTFDISYKKITQEFYTYASPLFVFNAVAITIGLFDIWLLQRVGGSVQTGYYGIAYAIAAMCFLFTSALTPIITREFTKSFANKDMELIRSLFNRYIPMLYGVSAYFGIFIAFQSENLLQIFTDEKFKDAYFVLVIMAFYPIHQTYGQLNGSLFLATGNTKLYRNIGLSVSLFGLVFSYFFIYVWGLGAVGFAWKMVLIQIIGVNIQLYYNTLFLKISIVPFLKHQIYAVSIFALLAYLSSMISLESAFFEFIIAGVCYSVLVIIFVFFFPSLVAVSKQEVSNVLDKIRSTIRS